MKRPLVEVIWHDAVGDTGPMRMKKARKLKLRRRRTVGFLLDENDERILVAADYNEHDKEWSDVSAIPVSWMVAVIRLCPAS